MDDIQAAGLRASSLPGGLVVITERLPYIHSVALGISFHVGGRDDPPDKAGMAHMIEHMVFKGTAQRDAIAINIAAESLGAELNAFTDKEVTTFYGRFPSDEARPVTALLNEIVTGPAFQSEELAREKQVVAEEIRTSDEDPDSCAVNLMFKAFYGDHPMGVPTSGMLESVQHITDESLRGFYRAHYGPGSAIAVAVGDVDHDETIAELAPLLAHHVEHRKPTRAAPRPRRGVFRTKTRSDLSQVYVCLAWPAFAYSDRRRFALSVLNTGLGGGVSSRLFQRLREREALVYSVSSFTELYGDSGLLGLYFVTDNRKLGRCLEVVREELRELRRHGLKPEEFERARNMTRSAVLLALESPTSRMMRLARSYQLLGRVVTVDETVADLSAVTPEDTAGLIDELLSVDFRCAGAVGPLAEAEFDGLLEAQRA